MKIYNTSPGCGCASCETHAKRLAAERENEIRSGYDRGED